MFRKSIVAMVLVAVLGFASTATAQSNGSHFKRGDANSDSALNIGDAVFVLGFLFSGGAAPVCEDAADVNDDGGINIADAISLLGFLFSGGVQPAEPFETWEGDPTPDTLGCKPESVITGDITADIVLTNDTTWILQSGVFVKAGATMTIQPGTTVVGDFASEGFLLVERNATLNADGTAVQPIVFTSEFGPGARNRSDWGGVLLLGNGDNNYPTKEAEIEGSPSTFFGGGSAVDVNDSSGSLSYVRIEWGGTEIFPNNEINGLTLGAVGFNTGLNNIMVKYNLDDGIENFGGHGSGKNFIVYGCDDDDFDCSFGWNGNVQYLVTIKNNGGERGFEFDNAEPPSTPQGFDAVPVTNGQIWNFTTIGVLDGATQAADSGAVIRRGANGTWGNGIVEGWADAGLDLDEPETTTNGTVIWTGVTLANNAENAETGDDETPGSGYLYTSVDVVTEGPFNQEAAASVLLSFSAGTDFLRPAAASLDAAVANPGGFFDPAPYRGAIDPNAGASNWTQASWVSFLDN